MPALSNHPQPSTWRAWKAQNGNKGWYWRAPLAIEWALEWFVDRLRSLALVDLLDLAGRATVLVAVVLWFSEAGDRAKERHYRAWELINSARGSTGDGGRRDALQDLNKDGVSLRGAPLECADLGEIDLRGASLIDANLRGANLYDAKLQGADLSGAKLQGAFLNQTDLRGASLYGAELQGAFLNYTDLRGANLYDAKLQGAILVPVYLQKANLQSADLQGADLEWADLRDADFGFGPWSANLTGANLARANLKGALGLTQEQLNAANGDDGTQLPDGFIRPAHWLKAEGTEAPPALQPDDAGGAPPAAGASGPCK